MPVSSEQMFKFVQERAIAKKVLGPDRELLDYEAPTLEGKPLANALEVVAQLAAVELGIPLQQQQLDFHTKTRPLTGGGGAMAN